MTVQSHEATITIACSDAALEHVMVFAATRAIGEFYGETLVPNSVTIFADRDNVHTARWTWQTSSPDARQGGSIGESARASASLAV